MDRGLDERLHPRGLLTGCLVEARRRVVYAVAGDLDQASAGPLARRLRTLAIEGAQAGRRVPGPPFHE